MIKEWAVSNSNSHIHSMTYRAGQLTVPTPGRYYIYTQLYFITRGRVEIRVNNSKVTMLQPAFDTDNIPLYTGGLFILKGGDVISLHTNHNVTIYMSSSHSYFGAFCI